jgi:pimeloyl-ACP methyl ester carboxylesterase
MRLVSLPVLLACTIFAQPKLIPPPGIAVPAETRALLQARIAEVDALMKPHSQHALAVDVLVLRDAVATALEFNEFFKADEFDKAKKLLDEALLRARQLAAGQTPWAQARGLVVRGYRSEIDHSVQPYGLVIPKDWRNGGRVDLWFHGRGETLSEVNFLYERMNRPGEFTPADAMVLHLYGRYCNASKFAGETDLFEALDSVRKHYGVDENRIFVRGFSMGGATSWHVGAHYADLWAGVAPGAGFAETSEYQNLAAKPARPWYETKLFRLYDATEYALNFFNTPLVAYSGEKDKQIQAAQIMGRYLAKEGMELAHVTGPDTEHKYHPAAKIEIARRLDEIARLGRDPYPQTVHFATHTLRYNQMRWIRVEGLERHWEKARVDARITDTGDIELEVANVNDIAIRFGSGGWKGAKDRAAVLRINGVSAGAIKPRSDGSLQGRFAKLHGAWSAGELSGLRKRHGLQGPIDDAFYSSFLMVLPSGAGTSDAVDRWVKSESAAAIADWRRIFRGKARVKLDSEVTETDIAGANLVLWGDAKSNRLLARLAEKLPVQWNGGNLQLGAASCSAANCMPVLIYPNPLNPSRYVVLNSGPTLRGEANASNSLQTPKLPDWALVDLSEAPGPQRPGKIVDAGFFDEEWRVAKKP